MKKRKVNIIFGVLSIILLITLIVKLKNVPGGMILSGLFWGGIFIVGIVISSFILSAILKNRFKKISYWTLFFLFTSISFLVFHYKLYSPTLTIIVPNGYRGEVHLVLSNVKDNILKIDNNGIGYLTEWTFEKTYLKPIVKQENGKNLEEYLIGFNPTTFFSVGTHCCFEQKEIKTLSFKIGTKPHLSYEFFDSPDLFENIDKNKVIFIKPDSHTVISETMEIK